jgi:hypothetical protein
MRHNGGERTMEVKINYTASEILRQMKEDILNGEFYVYSA